MMKYLLLFFSVIIMSSCVGTPRYIIQDIDNGKSFSLKTGESFELRLASQMSTGYSWKVLKIKGADKSVDSKVITLSDGTTGGRDVQVFTFKAGGKGDGEIELHYTLQAQTVSEKKFIVKLTIE